MSGVIITKLDGTARAGYVVGMTRDLGLPVKLIGVGEKIDDLQVWLVVCIRPWPEGAL